jgi:hypothetical protein
MDDGEGLSSLFSLTTQIFQCMHLERCSRRGCLGLRAFEVCSWGKKCVPHLERVAGEGVRGGGCQVPPLQAALHHSKPVSVQGVLGHVVHILAAGAQERDAVHLGTHSRDNGRGVGVGVEGVSQTKADEPVSILENSAQEHNPVEHWGGWWWWCGIHTQQGDSSS